MEHVDLGEANLQNSVFSKANLSNANMITTKNLRFEQVSEAEPELSFRNKPALLPPSLETEAKESGLLAVCHGGAIPTTTRHASASCAR